MYSRVDQIKIVFFCFGISIVIKCDRRPSPGQQRGGSEGTHTVVGAAAQRLIGSSIRAECLRSSFGEIGYQEGGNYNGSYFKKSESEIVHLRLFNCERLGSTTMYLQSFDSNC